MMAIKYNKSDNKDEKTISFKEALGIISFKKKDVSKTLDQKKNDLKTTKK